MSTNIEKNQIVVDSLETLNALKIYNECADRLKNIYIKTIGDLAKMNLEETESRTGINLEDLSKIKIMAIRQLQFENELKLFQEDYDL